MGDQQTHFAKGAVRWLGLWLGSAVALVENRRCVNRTRQAEARIRRIVSKHGIPPVSARNLQLAVIQVALLYASEIASMGESSAATAGECRRMTSAMGRTTLGCFRSALLEIVMTESKLTPARSLLDSR